MCTLSDAYDTLNIIFNLFERAFDTLFLQYFITIINIRDNTNKKKLVAILLYKRLYLNTGYLQSNMSKNNTIINRTTNTIHIISTKKYNL